MNARTLAFKVAILAFCATIALGQVAQSPPWVGDQVGRDSIFRGFLSIPEYVQRNIDLFATKEYWQRKQELRSLQRRGYLEALVELRRGDGPFAVCSYVKTLLQIHYSVNHTPILGRHGVSLPFDWSFPRNPWRSGP